MKRIVLVILVVLALIIINSFTGCRYFNVSPADGFIIKNVIEKPSIDDLDGIWELDDLSYELIKRNGYDETQKVILKLHKKGNFEFINFPEFADIFSDTKQKRFINLTGKWTIDKDAQTSFWGITMNFDESEFYKTGLYIEYDLYSRNDSLVIWNFIGDPDSGERFLFIKKL